MCQSGSGVLLLWLSSCLDACYIEYKREQKGLTVFGKLEMKHQEFGNGCGTEIKGWIAQGVSRNGTSQRD